MRLGEGAGEHRVSGESGMRRDKLISFLYRDRGSRDYVKRVEQPIRLRASRHTRTRESSRHRLFVFGHDIFSQDCHKPKNVSSIHETGVLSAIVPETPAESTRYQALLTSQRRNLGIRLACIVLPLIARPPLGTTS